MGLEGFGAYFLRRGNATSDKMFGGKYEHAMYHLINLDIKIHFQS
jgi:hypothetical protein